MYDRNADNEKRDRYCKTKDHEYAGTNCGD